MNGESQELAEIVSIESLNPGGVFGGRGACGDCGCGCGSGFVAATGGLNMSAFASGKSPWSTGWGC